jgi:hypothetical protein
MVDVSDVALAHLRAVERSSVAAGKRYLLVGAEFSSSAVAIAAREAFPEKASRFPPPGGEAGHEMPPHFDWDVTPCVSSPPFVLVSSRLEKSS